MRQELMDSFAGFIAGLKIPKIGDVMLPKDIEEKLMSLVLFCVTARSGIIRDSYTKEIEYVPDPEGPARLAKQLVTLGKALAIMGRSNEVSEKDYRLLYKIGKCSIARQRLLVINTLNEEGDYVTTSDVAKKVKYPTNTTRRFLEDLTALELIDRQHDRPGLADKWILSSKWKKFLEGAAP